MFAYDKHLTDKELAILEDLCTFRALTTEMIQHRHFEKKGNYVNVLLSQLRKEGYIRSSILSKSRKGRKGFAYHQISETGKECLIRHGVSVEGQWKNIYLSDYQIPNLLLANEVLLEYESLGWQVWDSRQTKSAYGLDYRNNIQGMLFSPNGERYGLYALETRITENVVGRIQSEIRKHTQIENWIVLAKGMDSYNLFIEYGFENDNEEKRHLPQQKRLLTIGKLVIEPFKINFEKRKAFSTEEQWIQRLCAYYGFKIKTTDIEENRRQSFPIIIEHQGEEMYFVDLTDADLNKYNDVIIYNESLSSRQWERRKVVVVTLQIENKANLKLDELQIVDHLLLDTEEFKQLCTK
ncbi:hypothetical protein [Bacillus benzoevorans]|uniref:Replication-relaxation n=1 Tax=Bacillus benzoevorans TaxID=1456 RepID=A0A7X0LYT8_9BACI|nr:hypothetical protein [Bacillus benzoevorans]MBB6447867.1 hypothetical protein [Bacillus benzoevorans]